MPREDYLRRMIVEMGRVWSRIVSLIKSQQFPAARMTIDQAYQQLLGLSADAVRAHASHELIARLLLAETPDQGRDKCIALAALLRASGDIATAENDVDAGAADYRKALEILLTVLVHTPNIAPPDYAPTVADLVAVLAMYELPLETNLLLMRYYEQIGAYAKAEDALFEMLDAAPGNPDLLAIGHTFYARLQDQSDERLIAGDLARAEVEAGLTELKRHIPAQVHKP